MSNTKGGSYEIPASKIGSCFSSSRNHEKWTRGKGKGKWKQTVQTNNNSNHASNGNYDRDGITEEQSPPAPVNLLEDSKEEMEERIPRMGHANLIIPNNDD
ncbi:hypothetical protein GBA52_014485 [Prunus armeniaca]|nr:hypothetical protein GBA52_014485 [Prunus armeniaca]